jgi:precorrin-6B methylase 2
MTATFSNMAGVVPERVRWAVETLAIAPEDRLLQIGGGTGSLRRSYANGSMAAPSS